MDKIYEFTGNENTTVTIPDLSNYNQIMLALKAKDNSIVNSVIMPRSTFVIGTSGIKVYGESSSQWGKCVANSNTSATFNRTTANTYNVTLYGIN